MLRVVTTEATRTNEQVRHDVQAELKWYAGIEPNEIGAAVKDMPPFQNLSDQDLGMLADYLESLK